MRQACRQITRFSIKSVSRLWPSLLRPCRADARDYDKLLYRSTGKDDQATGMGKMEKHCYRLHKEHLVICAQRMHPCNVAPLHALFKLAGSGLLAIGLTLRAFIITT